MGLAQRRRNLCGEGSGRGNRDFWRPGAGVAPGGRGGGFWVTLAEQKDPLQHLLINVFFRGPFLRSHISQKTPFSEARIDSAVAIPKKACFFTSKSDPKKPTFFPLFGDPFLDPFAPPKFDHFPHPPTDPGFLPQKTAGATLREISRCSIRRILATPLSVYAMPRHTTPHKNISLKRNFFPAKNIFNPTFKIFSTNSIACSDKQ